MAILSKIKENYFKYEHFLSPLVLIGGFIFDNLTLTRIDLWIDNLIIIIYLSVALGSIIYLSIYDSSRPEHRWLKNLAAFAPFVLQFVIGGLFSAFFVFYRRSASFLDSWPFLLLLAGLLVGNELFRERYQRLVFRLGIFFIVLFSYAVFAMPVLLGKMGADIFLLSGAVSLVIIFLVMSVLWRFLPERMRAGRNALLISIGMIYFGFNLLYFTNVIPPIPLALQESGVYHDVKRSGSDYTVEYEPVPWYRFWRISRPVFHWQTGQPVYVFSAVFAPTKIATRIYHRWSYYDPASEDWVEKSRIGYPITGGRDGGYRGWTVKYNVWPGKWRVDVITESGQVLGRTVFYIVSGPPPELESGIR